VLQGLIEEYLVAADPLQQGFGVAALHLWVDEAHLEHR
jgi:hypothetical protein